MAFKISVLRVLQCFKSKGLFSPIYRCYFPKLSTNRQVYCVKTMVVGHESVLKRHDNIIKSEEDNRHYCGLELINGMKVLLISDPSTDKSAAALNVQIGSMSDPPDIPGLAHFCEHMLFLGTKKYPVENEYNKFLHEHGGSSNAYTAADNTCYFFDVSTMYLKDALDRFAQFFLSPLFTESSTEKEVNAVDSEHEKNLQIDSWRLAQLEKATCNPNHDFSKFGTGNIETLQNIPKSKGMNIQTELLRFHEKHYSANIMALAVLGKESIEELLDVVVPLFSEVANANVDIPRWKEHPFDSKHLQLQGYVVPVKDIRSLNITFPIPDLQEQYQTNPGMYLGHLIGHEGPGSLLSELKSLGWVNNLVSGYKAGAKGFAFFIANLDLTEEGLEHVNDIVTLMFQYLTMLKKEGPQEWIFQECKELAAMTFRFKDREKPQLYTCSLASVMFNFPMQEILCGPYLLHDYKPELIAELLSMLTPDNIRIAVVGKKFESFCTEVEKWYGTKYKLQSLKEAELEHWKNVGLHPNFKLPPPNEFIPTSFELTAKDSEATKHPELIQNTTMGRLWFKQDDQFFLPKASFNIEFESPMAYVDPLHYNMNHLFVRHVKDSLNEYAYAAELAGLEYCLSGTKFGIFLSIKGYNDKQHVLLQKIMDKLTSLTLDKRRFEILKEELRRGLKNFKAEQPHRHAIYYTSLLLAEKMWNNEELLNCLDEITVDNVQQMIPQLLSRVHFEALSHGNLSKKKALSLMNIVESALEKNMNTKPLMPSQLVRDREVQLSDGCHYVYEVINDVHSCSSVETYYQCGIQETRANMLLELLCELLSEPCFNFLRTQEQLGYIVCSGARRSNGAQGIRILVQSDKSPSYVDGRIEAFVQYFEKYIQEMTDDEFQNHILSLSTIRLEKPKKLSVQTAKYWLEIASRQYNFDRDNIEVECLSSITKEELYNYFKDMIAYDAPRRKKLSVHVISSVSKHANDVLDDVLYSCMPEEVSTDNGLIPPPPAFRPPVKIENVVAFKNSLGLYPLVPSWIHIPSPHFNIPEKSKL
ncbi:insulin-degrading enzyme-like [Uloborus diversus]|uniref:insulin-degrading enzyme-like n=1 Tax=Uloborus diversus TaxID=327109 RepID=UPI00240965F0|nr:insulin-degrading enzyme-like [Uloborus diversus]